MAVSWNIFEKNLVDAIKSRRPKSEDDFAKLIATEYDSAVLTKAQDMVLKNVLVSANKGLLESALKTAFKSAKSIKDPEQAQRIMRTSINTGILAYWTGAKLGFGTPPPGAVSVVTNLVVMPGIPPDVKITNVSEPEKLAKELSTKFKMHLLTVKVITSGVTANGVPVILPINGLN
jgi:hypothetical protein